jgi:hypothetical protein
MKAPLALLALPLLAFGPTACGSSGTGADPTRTHSTVATTRTAQTTTSATSPGSYSRIDSDKDNDASASDKKGDNNAILRYGHAASASDARAIKSLVKRYYAAALASDGATGCSLIYSTLAEAIPEDYGISPPGPPYMRGTTCPAVMTLLFKHEHDHLAAELPKLRVRSVRLEEHHGLAVLSFGALPERQLLIAREGPVWKLKALLDMELP